MNPPEYYFKVISGTGLLGELIEFFIGGRGGYYSDILIVNQQNRKPITMEFEFKQGRNFFSLPLIPLDGDCSIEGLFGDEIDKISMVSTYYESEWLIYSDIVKTLDSIETTKGYVVIAKEDFTLNVEGYKELDESLTLPEIIVKPGWNLIGTHSKLIKLNRLFKSHKDDVRVIRYYKGLFGAGLEELDEEEELVESEAYWVFLDRHSEIKLSPITGK